MTRVRSKISLAVCKARRRSGLSCSFSCRAAPDMWEKEMLCQLCNNIYEIGALDMGEGYMSVLRAEVVISEVGDK